jgi:hypothetical protein
LATTTEAGIGVAILINLTNDGNTTASSKTGSVIDSAFLTNWTTDRNITASSKTGSGKGSAILANLTTVGNTTGFSDSAFETTASLKVTGTGTPELEVTTPIAMNPSATGSTTIAAVEAAVTASQLLGHLDQLISHKPVLAGSTTAEPLAADSETAHALLSALRSHVAEHNLISLQLIANFTQHLSSFNSSDINEREATKSRLRELIRRVV